MMSVQGSCQSRSDPQAWWPRLVEEELQGAKCKEPNARLVHHGSRMGPVLPKLLVHGEGATSALRIQFTPW